MEGKGEGGRVGGVGPEGLTKLLLLSLISVRVETIRRWEAEMRRKTRVREVGFCRRTLQAMEEKGD